MPTAIITGASRGLGLELTKALSADGWRVVVDARHEGRLFLATQGLPNVIPVPGDVSDDWHRHGLVEAAGDTVDLLINNASVLGPSPQPALAHYPPAELERVLRVNVVAPLALAQLAIPRMPDGAAIVNITSDAAVEPYAGWGGYGTAKAALDQLTAILAVEHPDLRIYAADPGDMNTQLHQEAFPGEDISDRPPPSDSVPGILNLVRGGHPSGRYSAAGVPA
jgi:NAD(P)-dependent dehydrogenase (short-subunit alcohol dehydrogenase family)